MTTPVLGGQKGRVGSVSRDYQLEKMITGWDWFNNDRNEDKVQLVRVQTIGDNSCFYHSVSFALSPTYSDEEKILEYGNQIPPDIGARVSDRVYRGRQEFADNFRRGLAHWLMSPAINPVTGMVYTEAEARAYLWSQPLIQQQLLQKEARTIGFGAINATFDYGGRSIIQAAQILKAIIAVPLPGEDEATVATIREQGRQWIIQNTTDRSTRTVINIARHLANLDVEVLRATSSQDLVNMVWERSRFTPESLNAAIAEIPELNLDTVRADIADLEAAIVSSGRGVETLRHIVELMFLTLGEVTGTNTEVSTINTEIALERLGLQQRVSGRWEPAPQVTPELVTATRKYLTKTRTRMNKLTGLLGNPARPTFITYPNTLIREIIETGQFQSWVAHSFDISTGELFSPAKAALEHDPRTIKYMENGSAHSLVNDPEALALPLNLNYFLMREGLNIENFATTGGLRRLLEVILPKTRNGRVVGRDDAGDTDVIPMIPSILGIDIYIMHVYHDHMRVYASRLNQPPSSSRSVGTSPTILINHISSNFGKGDAGHFEIIGAVDPSTNAIQTVFAPNHPLIAACRMYETRLQEVGGNPDVLYSQLKVSKVTPSLPLPLPLPGLTNPVSATRPLQPIPL